MLITYLDWLESEHYLDDFILILEVILAILSKIESHETGYWFLTNCFRIPRQETKDCIGTIVLVFGIEIDTNIFVARIATDKLQRARESTGWALSQESLTLHKAQSLIGFFSFCARVVQLG